MTRRSKTDVQQAAGTHLIHVAARHLTFSRLAHDLLRRAVRRCQDRNVLIVATGGNDRGAYWCIPAVLPGVLTVDAMRDNGQPLQCSNWGGPDQRQGGPGAGGREHRVMFPPQG